MKTKKQPKNSGTWGNDDQAFKTLKYAIKECRGKPPYDYQRIIVCHTRRAAPGRRFGVRLLEYVRGLDSKCAMAALDVGKSADRGLDMLESIVFFVNRTRGVVVLLAVGQSLARCHDRWPATAAQIRRRIHLTIEFGR